MTKFFTIGGALMLTIGLIVLFSIPIPSGEQRDGAYGDVGGDLQRIAGYALLIASAVFLLIALIRVMRKPPLVY